MIELGVGALAVVVLAVIRALWKLQDRVARLEGRVNGDDRRR